MPSHYKDKQGKQVKFIRKNGRVIPIRSKGGAGGAAPKKRQYKGRGELGSKERKRLTKIKDRSQYELVGRGVTSGSLIGMGFGYMEGYRGKKAMGKFALAGAIGGTVGSLIGGNIAKKIAGSKLREDRGEKGASARAYKSKKRRKSQGF